MEYKSWRNHYVLLVWKGLPDQNTLNLTLLKESHLYGSSNPLNTEASSEENFNLRYNRKYVQTVFSETPELGQILHKTNTLIHDKKNPFDRADVKRMGSHC